MAPRSGSSKDSRDSGDSDLAREFLQQLQARLKPKDFETWFRDVRCLYTAPRTFHLTARNRFRKTWVENKFRQTIQGIADAVCGPDSTVVIHTAGDASPATPQADDDRVRNGRRPSDGPPRGATPSTAAAFPGQLPPPTLLRSEFIFDHFLECPSSRVARAAAIAVTEHPGKTFNPVYIFGKPGVGKTHLLQAICHALAATTHLRQMYVSAEKFTNDYVDALEASRVEPFRKTYRGVDALIVDDLHFLSDKKKIQSELLHTLIALVSQHRQVVFGGNGSLEELDGFHPSLLSHLRSGLVAPIDPPRLEMRVAIIVQKARLRGHDLPEEVAKVLAESIDENLRELEGALTNLIGRIELEHRTATPEMARLALEEHLGGDAPDPSTSAVTIDRILEAVQSYFGFSTRQLVSRSKVRSLVYARQVGMYLSRELTPLSLEQIGRHYGGRDHSTVLYAQRRIQERYEAEPYVRADVVHLRSRLLGRHGP